MFDDTLKSKVNREVGRLNGELCDLKEHEESLRIRRARLEVEMRQAIAMRDMFELLGRLDRQPTSDLRVVREPVMPEHPNGPQFVRPAPPPPPSVAPLGSYNIVMTCPAGKAPPIGGAAVPATPRLPPLRTRPAHKKRSTKPSGLLPTADMVLTVLEGAGWQQPHQITSEIQGRWWPGATSRDVGPVMWRLWKDGRLEKSDHGYRLPSARSEGGHVIGNGATA
jgi:hypothetical protein